MPLRTRSIRIIIVIPTACSVQNWLQRQGRPQELGLLRSLQVKQSETRPEQGRTTATATWRTYALWSRSVTSTEQTWTRTTCAHRMATRLRDAIADTHTKGKSGRSSLLSHGVSFKPKTLNCGTRNAEPSTNRDQKPQTLLTTTCHKLSARTLTSTTYAVSPAVVAAVPCKPAHAPRNSQLGPGLKAGLTVGI